MRTPEFKIELPFEKEHDLLHFEGGLIYALKLIAKPDAKPMNAIEADELLWGVKSIADTLDRIHGFRLDLNSRDGEDLPLKKVS